MAEVTVTVGGRRYPVFCNDGEEARVRDLARRIDAEASAFAGAGPAVPEPRLLLMSALMIADKLDEAEAQLRERAAEAQPAPEPAPVEAPRGRDLFAGLDEDELARRIEDATRRVEALAVGGGGED